ncbi:MAG: tetratricopeptide repeat protein [Planctomycetaceae bacterium]|nr:tetratricopeptide repeat protein [Planctomycetaceae bacterium]
MRHLSKSQFLETRIGFFLLLVLLSLPLAVARSAESFDIQAELDQRQQHLNAFLQADDEAEKVRLVELAYASEKRLLEQNLPADLRRHLLDEHLGLMIFLADHFELRDVNREIALRQEIVERRIEWDGGNSHWETRLAKNQLRRAKFTNTLSDEQRRRLVRALEIFREGKQHQQDGQPELAISKLKECAAIHQDLLGPEYINTAFALRAYVDAMVTVERGGEAFEEAKLAAEIAYRALGQSPVVAGALADCANCLMQRGDAKWAATMQQHALRMSQAVLGEEHEQTITQLNNLAYFLSETDDLEKAFQVAKSAGMAFEKMGDKRAIAENANLTGTIAMKLDHHEEAYAAFVQAARMQEQIQGPQAFEVAVAWGNASQAATRRREISEALVFSQKSLSIIDATIGRNDPRAAQILIQHASVLRKLGRMKEAAPLVERACDLLARQHGTDHPSYALATLDLAVIQFERGQRQLAESTVLNSVEVFETRLGPKSWAFAVAMSRLAQLQAKNQERDLARQAIEVAGTIAAESLSQDHPEYASFLSRAGDVYSDLGEHGLAKATLNQAVGLIEEKYGSRHPEYARTVSQLGNVLLETDERTRGAELVEVGERLLLEALGESHPQVFEAMNNVARAHRLLGDPTTAIAELTNLEQKVRQELGDDNEIYADVLLEMGRSLLLTGDQQAAEDALLKAAQIATDQLGDRNEDARQALELIALLREKGTAGLTNEVLLRVEKKVQRDLAKAAETELDEFARRHQRVTDLMNRVVR